MTNFKFQLKDKFIIDDSQYWICERMIQEVMEPHLQVSWINELYLLVPVGEDYKFFARLEDHNANYYSVEQLDKIGIANA